MSQFLIDVDAEAVFLDGAWYTREDLSRRIRAMLDSGDFNIATASMALQDLTQTLSGVRTLAFRCTPDLAEALTRLAAQLGQSMSAVVREAVTRYITDATSNPPPKDEAPEQVVAQPDPGLAAGADHDDGGIVILAQASASSDDLPKVMVEEPPVVFAGPGALKAAGVENPLELTQVKRQPAQGTEEPGPSEHRWFKQ